MDAARRAVDLAGDRTAAFLSPSLRQHALRHGWPEHVANSLGVGHRDGGFYPTYPQELAEQVLDLEYGDGRNEPMPALRRFLNRAPQQASQSHHDEVMMSLIAAEMI